MRLHEVIGVVLQVGGVVLQVVGLGVTGIGAWKTWHALPQGLGERFLEPIIKRVKAAWTGVGAGLRWLGTQADALARKVLRRPRPVEMRASGTFATVEAQDLLVASGRTGFGSLPDDVEEALMELDRRTRELLERLQNSGKSHTDDVAALRDELAQLREDLEENVHDLEESDRRLVVSGIRWEVLGLSLIGSGVVFQWVGALLF